MTAKALTNKLKVYRAMHDWTQAKLARRVDVTRKTINTVENGRYAPAVFLALRVAQALDVPVEELFRLSDEPSEHDA